MDKLSKYIVADILDSFGYWIEIIRLERVCKRWKAIIKGMPHRFSLQGYRSKPNLTASNVDIKPILERLLDYKLTSMDLRNVTIACPKSLGLLLLHQPNLKKLNLTNAYAIAESVEIVYTILAEKNRLAEFQLEELRLTNLNKLKIRYDFIATLYPKLQRLYISNTSLSTEDFRTITSRMRNLRLLDISFNPTTENNLESLNLQSHSLNLEQIFFQGSDEQAAILTKSSGIKFMGKTIFDVLNCINSENELYILETWLESGGDPDILFHSNFFENMAGLYLTDFFQKKNINDELLTSIFKILITHGIGRTNHHTDRTTDQQATLLNLALTKGYRNLSKLLLTQGFEVSPKFEKNSNEIPALTLAASIGNLEIIEEFVKLHLEKLNYYEFNNCSPICAAIKSENYEVVEYLVQAGVRIYPCKFNHNPFIATPKVLHYFLNECSQNFSDSNLGRLYEAAQYYLTSGRLEEFVMIVKYIGVGIIHKESEIIPDYNKRSSCLQRFLNRPLMVLASEDGLLPMVELLIDFGYDVDIADKFGWTPLMSAAASGRIDVVKYLCSKGAKVDVKERNGKTALHLAAQDGHSEVVKIIIEYGGNKNLRCKKEKKPLDYALEAEKVDRIRKEKTVEALGAHLMQIENRRSRNKCNIF